MNEALNALLPCEFFYSQPQDRREKIQWEKYMCIGPETKYCENGIPVVGMR